jgi:hypothetical protein
MESFLSLARYAYKVILLPSPCLPSIVLIMFNDIPICRVVINQLSVFGMLRTVLIHKFLNCPKDINMVFRVL